MTDDLIPFDDAPAVTAAPATAAVAGRPAADADQQRRTDLAKIHLARKQLQMDDATYRAMLKLVANVNSSSDLTLAGRLKVLQHLQKLGARFTTSRQKRTTVAQSKEMLASKVKALLADGKYPDSYADGMAKRMFAVDRWEWLESEQLHKLVAALMYNQRRKQKKGV